MIRTQKVKVVYIISNIDKAIGFEWTAKYLDKAKFDLSFVLLNPKPSYLAKYLNEIGVRVTELNYRGKKDILVSLWNVFNILRKEKPDVIHTHLVEADIIGLFCGKILGIKKRIYTRHNSNFHKKYHSNAEKFDSLCNYLSTDIAAISKNVANILIAQENVNPKKVHLVYHGFDLSAFENVDKQEIANLCDKYNPKNKRPVIGVIARYMHWKGIHFIIPAFKNLLVDFPNAILILANAKKGDYKDEIGSLLNELPNNSFIEIEFEHNLFALYQLFDVFVHTPIDEEVEAFGQIYVEALAAGIPSVFSNSGIAREFIKDKQNALIVNFQNTTEIYQSMKLILTDDLLRKNLSKQGRYSVNRMFSLQNLIDSLENLYTKN